jgi:hypothetical protein
MLGLVRLNLIAIKYYVRGLISLQVGNYDLPYNTLNFTTNVPVDETVRYSLRILLSDASLNSVSIQNIIAQVGTAVLEWNKLTQYSGNSTYKALAEKAMRKVATNVSRECGECRSLTWCSLDFFFCLLARTPTWSRSAEYRR